MLVVFVYQVPGGIGCRYVGFVGASFSFWCWAFCVFFWALVYMVWGAGE